MNECDVLHIIQDCLVGIKRSNVRHLALGGDQILYSLVPPKSLDKAPVILHELSGTDYTTRTKGDVNEPIHAQQTYGEEDIPWTGEPL